jgi:hypothetical protein
MRRDPRVRKDGHCAQCKGERTIPRTHHKDISVGVYLADPFCSAICARTFHNNPIPPMLSGDRHDRALAAA